MSIRTAREMFAAGEKVRVTNHYIQREDHPCFGTRETTIQKVSTSGLTLDGGLVPWPKSADVIHDTNTLILGGHPHPGDLFLTIEKI